MMMQPEAVSVPALHAERPRAVAGPSLLVASCWRLPALGTAGASPDDDCGSDAGVASQNFNGSTGDAGSVERGKEAVVTLAAVPARPVLVQEAALARAAAITVAVLEGMQ